MNDGGPAFPLAQNVDDALKNGIFKNQGMSLRDYFAAHATDKDVEDHHIISITGNVMSTREQAKFRYADTMLLERSRQKEGV